MHPTCVINVVGLTSALLGEDTPNLNALRAEGSCAPVRAAVPCYAHASGDTLQELGRLFPKTKKLITEQHLNSLANISDGVDGRRLRKAVITACAANKETALDIERLAFQDLQAAIRQVANIKHS